MKPKVKKIRVERRVDPMKKIIDDSLKHDKSLIKEIDIKEVKESEEKTVEIRKDKDLSDTDPNIKRILVDSIEEEIKKKGSGIKIE